MKRMIFPLVFGLLALFALSCSEKSASTGEDLSAAKADFERACSACHSLDVPLGVTKSAEGWEDAVKRMKDKGAAMDHKSVERVAKYLYSIRGKR